MFKEPLSLLQRTRHLQNLNSITAEALNIKDNILSSDNHKNKMKYHWIDYCMPSSSGRLDSPLLYSTSLIRSSNERFRQ